MNLPPIIKQVFVRTSIISLVKVIGAVGRIPLFRMLGAEGAGLYQMAYSYYGLVLTIVTAGFSTTLALLTARNPKQGLRMFYLATILLSVIGGICAFLSYWLSPTIARMFGDGNLVWAIRSLAPAILIVPLISLIRGFLQGLEYYGYIAFSELIEQIVRVVTMIFLVSLWISYGTSYAVSGATFAAVTGAFVTLIFLVGVLYYPIRNRLAEQHLLGDQKVLGPGTLLFLKTSFAILATRLVIPLSDFTDTLIIPHRLQSIGMSPSEATAIFGVFTGIAATIVSIPSILTFALTHTLTTKITSDWQAKKWEQYYRRITRALQFGWLWGVSSALFLLLFSTPLSLMIMGDESLSMAIAYMSAAPLLAGLRDVTTTVLWGVDNQKVPLIGLIIGAVCSSLVLYVFIGIPAYEYIGVAAGLLAMDLIAAGWNLYFLYRKFRHLFSLNVLLKETAALLLFLLPVVYVTLYLLPRLHADELLKTVMSTVLFYLFAIIYISMRLRYIKIVT